MYTNCTSPTSFDILKDLQVTFVYRLYLSEKHIKNRLSFQPIEILHKAQCLDYRVNLT